VGAGRPAAAGRWAAADPTWAVAAPAFAYLALARRVYRDATMKTLTLTLAAALSLTLATAACGKKADDPKAKPTEGGGKAGGAAAPAKVEWKKIASLGLEVEVPADATIDDNTATAGFPSATLWAPGSLFLQGGDMIPSSYESSKAQAQKEMDGFKAFSKDEKTDAGWHLEYEGESTMDKSTVYGFTLRLSFDGKAFDCSSNKNSKEERDAAVKVCKSIRKAS
jgi:hypothetical protein